MPEGGGGGIKLLDLTSKKLIKILWKLILFFKIKVGGEALLLSGLEHVCELKQLPLNQTLQERGTLSHVGNHPVPPQELGRCSSTFFLTDEQAIIQATQWDKNEEPILVINYMISTIEKETK